MRGSTYNRAPPLCVNHNSGAETRTIMPGRPLLFATDDREWIFLHILHPSNYADLFIHKSSHHRYILAIGWLTILIIILYDMILRANELLHFWCYQ